MSEKNAVVIVSNGPGELSTWVKPIVESIATQKILEKESPKLLINLVLVPCPNSTGEELKSASKWNKFDFISDQKDFFKLLLNPKKFFKWPKNGVVIFLGGDQFWSVILSARLNYKHISYIEWISRWPRWTDKILAMNHMKYLRKALDESQKLLK